MYCLCTGAHVEAVYCLWSLASPQRMIYKLLSEGCHRRRLESSLVPPSILWMGPGVPSLQINMGTPAWNWLPKCHICHKTNQKVILCGAEGEGDFGFVLPWSEKIHADFPAINLFWWPFTESFASCWFKRHSASHSVACIYSHPWALQDN